MEGLCLTLGRNVPETGWSDRPGQVHAVSLGGCVTSGKSPVLSGSSRPGLQSGDSPSPFPRLFASGLPTPKEHGLPSKGLGGRSVCLFIEVKFT